MSFYGTFICRLKPEVEKQELELFRQGQFVIEDEEKEDANASTERPMPIDASVEVYLRKCQLIFVIFDILLLESIC